MADGKLDSTLASSHDIYALPWLLVQIYSAHVKSRVPWQHSVAGLSSKTATSIAWLASPEGRLVYGYFNEPPLAKGLTLRSFLEKPE